MGLLWARGCEYGLAYVVGSVQSNPIPGLPSIAVPDREAIRIGCEGLSRVARRRAVLPEEPVINIVMLIVQMYIDVEEYT